MRREYYNADCMDGLRALPDKSINLAIVDPPYGDGGQKWANSERFGEWFKKYKRVDHRGGGWTAVYGNRIVDWDVASNPDYFAELFRVSQYAIIWGGKLL